MRVMLLLALLCAGTSHAAARTRSVVFHVPARDFGILVGDVLVTEAVITVDQAATLDTRTVPVAGPVDAAVELRHVQVTDHVANGSRTIQIEMEYQSFFAPERVMQTELPGTTIGFTQGSTHFSANIPAWTYHVSPLRVVQRATDNLADLRGDHSVPAISLRWPMIGFIAAAALTLAASFVLAARIGVLPGLLRAAHPFDQAAQRIARLAASEANRAAAFREMHRAFDATAGTRVLAEDLDAFLLQHPRYVALRTDITAFFVASTHLFFSPAPPPGVPTAPLKALALLARRLRRLERAW